MFTKKYSPGMTAGHIVLLILFFLLVFLLPAGAGAERIDIPKGRITREYNGVTTVSEFDLDNAYIVTADDVTVVREPAAYDTAYAKGCDAYRLPDSHGFTVSQIGSGKKILYLETDGRFHCFYSAGVEGNMLKADTSREADYFEFLSDFSLGAESTGSTDVNIKFGIGEMLEVDLESKLLITCTLDDSKSSVDLSLSTVYEIERMEVTVKTRDQSIIPSIPLGHFTVDVVPPICELDFTPELFVTGQAEGDVSFKGEYGYGFSGTLTSEWPFFKNIKGNIIGPTFETLGAKIQGRVYIGIAWGPGFELFEGLLKLAATYKGGVVIEGTLDASHFKPEDNWSYVYHACEPMKCLQVTMHPQLGPASLDAAVAGKSFELIDFGGEVDFPIFYKAYSSGTFQDSATGKLCPHKAYRLAVQVVDERGSLLPDAVVSYAPYDETYKKFAQDVKMSTRGAELIGYWNLYIPKERLDNASNVEGNKVTVTATYKRDGKTYTAEATVYEKGKDDEALAAIPPDPKKLTLVIEFQRHIDFNKNSHFAVTNMPDSVFYTVKEGAYVTLPDTIPALHDYYGEYVFTGWNEKADGSGKAWNPGDRMPAEDRDTTLYAQWKEGPYRGKYTVYFNANGGSGAPGSMDADVHEKVTLPKKTPVMDNHTFIGWAFTSDAAKPDFQAGQRVDGRTLNPDLEDEVVLYALWAFDPVDMPVRLSYDMNGGPEGEKPAARWVKRGSQVTIDPHIPVWNQMYTFLGWSRDKDDTEGLAPGTTIEMNEDTVLYAIWSFHPAPYPNRIEFRDTGSGTAEGMPATIYFIHEEGAAVNLPDAVPTKPGVYFTGWNTASDGSGTMYSPGTKVSPAGNMILYAQWHILNDQYMILYNANGGTWAPPMQLVHKDELAVLTDEPALWENHKFMGWARTENADKPKYPHGQTNVLANTDNAPVIILYAVWGFDPVDKPVCLSYDMNGGPESQKPADQWIKAGSWIQVSTKEPVWNDLYLFTGWATTPYASRAEYEPGSSIKLEENTTLYALWYYTPSGTPVTVTYDLNGGLTGRPDVQTAPPDYPLALSTIRPAWDGQHTFLGWGLNKKDTKALYSPGEKVRFQRDTVLYAIWDINYRITEGNGAEWKRGSGTGLRFVADGNILYFHALLIDGNVVSRDSYTLSEGSTVIVLSEKYLKTLKTGTHSIRFRYYDGNADGSFTVSPKPVPKTGDPADFPLWIGLVLLGLAGIGGAAAMKRRKRG